MTIPSTHLRTLKHLLTLLDDLTEPWAITGSLGLALQGVDVSVNDIDIQTNQPGAYLLQQRLSPYTIQPVTLRQSSHLRSHLGRFNVGGIQVEVIGDIQKRTPNTPWSPPPNLPIIIHHIQLNTRLIPVLALAYEAEAYQALGRLETAAKIRQTLIG